MINITAIKLGTLPSKTFPPDDCNTYLYNREDGKTYYYHNGNETRIPTSPTEYIPVGIPIYFDIDVSKPIESVIDYPLPPMGKKFMFFKDNNLYSYDYQGVITPLIIGQVFEGLREW